MSRSKMKEQMHNLVSQGVESMAMDEEDLVEVEVN